MSNIDRSFVLSILGRLDRSYFPSVLLNVDTAGVEGEDRDWHLYEIGVTNGAEMSLEYLSPRLNGGIECLAKAYQEISVALEMTADSLELEALEPLLAARNTIAKHLKSEWDNFHTAILGWTCGILGIRPSYLEGKGDDFDAGALAATLLLLLTRGRPHPFWAWAVDTYPRKRNVNLGEIRGLYREFCREIPAAELTQLQGMGELASIAKQYITWARVEYEDMKRRIEVKTAGMPIPTEELALWVAHDVLKDFGD